MIYHNEIEPFARKWIRELMREGAIPEGDIDGRDIRDVCAADIIDYTQVHLFSGIAGWSYALDLAGWPVSREVWTCSCPCQPFSQAGSGAGFADERHLWPSAFWLIEQCRPATIFGEQVASPLGRAWLDLVFSDLEGIGYACGAALLCSAGVGAPNERHRNSNGAGLPLTMAAQLAGWPTPTAKRKAGGEYTDPEKAYLRAIGPHANDLQDFAQLAAWATPATRDYRTPNHVKWSERGGGKKGEQLQNQVAHMIPGASLNGLPAATERCGLLNPAFSLWLQGFPGMWARCAALATRSTRTSRRSSSRHARK